MIFCGTVPIKHANIPNWFFFSNQCFLLTAAACSSALLCCRLPVKTEIKPLSLQKSWEMFLFSQNAKWFRVHKLHRLYSSKNNVLKICSAFQKHSSSSCSFDGKTSCFFQDIFYFKYSGSGMCGDKKRDIIRRISLRWSARLKKVSAMGLELHELEPEVDLFRLHI